jgi:hypothetical protein
VTVLAPENPDLVLAAKEAPVHYEERDPECHPDCVTAEF